MFCYCLITSRIFGFSDFLKLVFRYPVFLINFPTTSILFCPLASQYLHTSIIMSSHTPTPTPTTSHSSILIVGAGIFGTSTAYHLSQSSPNPSTITVLDRFHYPPLEAASTDINKIVRSDYSSPFYMSLAYEAMDAWSSWPL